MLRRTLRAQLKHRPKTVRTEVSSNRHLEEPWLKKCQEVFVTPPFP